MQIAIRTDAAVYIGIGHVMRCITLANQLKEVGCTIHFVCRELDGHLGHRIKSNGHILHLLPPPREQFPSQDITNPQGYEGWLGEEWSIDLEQTREMLNSLQLDWFIVDHYALDFRWERGVRNMTRRIMVIDDLMNRVHDCDLLLDQTFGRQPTDYRSLVNSSATILTGSNFALLRPEFLALRTLSFENRRVPKFESILISMGGNDPSNVTAAILERIETCPIPLNCNVKVVLGGGNPNIRSIIEMSSKLKLKVDIDIDSANMAELMSVADLAIGAAGATSWERCCLGVPSIVLILADNQRDIGRQLEISGAAMLAGNLEELGQHVRLMLESPILLQDLSSAARRIVDGRGCILVARAMLGGER